MARKPRLSFLDIWNMSFGFLGIQMGFALQLANTSRIFKTLGSNVEDLAVYWIAGPVTGLIVQPIIGYMSDRTWHPRFGRRRPYFMVGAILALFALFIMPNSSVLWFAIGMLWIMDASFNIAMEPFRAYVGDRLPKEQLTQGFATQSFLIGIGAVIASSLPWILTNIFGVSNTAPEGIIPTSVKWSFYIGGVGFLLAVMYTVFKSKEYSPEEMKSFEDESSDSESFEDILKDDAAYASNARRQLMFAILSGFVAFILAYLIYSNGWKRDLYILSGIFGLFATCFAISGHFQRNGKSESPIATIMNDLQFMPDTMKRISAVQFFSWFGLFAMWIYTTDVVAANVFGTADSSSKAFNDAGDWVGICFAMYNAVPIAVAFLLPLVAKKITRKVTHMIALFAGAAGLIGISLITEKYSLLFAMVGIGIAWTSILSMPYAILTNTLKPGKLGYYMGVFNFFIVLPQIVAASVLGFFISTFFDKDPKYAVIIGAVSMVIAGLLCFFINDKEVAGD